MPRAEGPMGHPASTLSCGQAGICVECKRLARLMRQAQLAGISRRRRKGLTQRNAKAQSAPDLVKRNFSAQRPDQLWVADIKHIPTLSALAYLSVVVDAYSRRVVGWAWPVM